MCVSSLPELVKRSHAEHRRREEEEREGCLDEGVTQRFVSIGARSYSRPRRTASRIPRIARGEHRGPRHGTSAQMSAPPIIADHPYASFLDRIEKPARYTGGEVGFRS